MSDKPKSKLVSVGSLYRESNKTRESQAALLARHGIEPELTTRSGKGFAHWVTQENSEILRARMQEDADLQASKKARASESKKAAVSKLSDANIADFFHILFAVHQLLHEHVQEISVMVRAIDQRTQDIKDKTLGHADLTSTLENMFVQMRSLYVEIAAISEELKSRQSQAS